MNLKWRCVLPIGKKKYYEIVEYYRYLNKNVKVCALAIIIMKNKNDICNQMPKHCWYFQLAIAMHFSDDSHLAAWIVSKIQIYV